MPVGAAPRFDPKGTRFMFVELDYAVTPIGALSLRRRFDPGLGADVYEVKLGEDFLMSSAYTASEEALATMALDSLRPGPCDVLVGGLGLGYTAKAALDHPATRSLLIAEYLSPVVEWHRDGLLPVGAAIYDDPRTEMRVGDFFAMAREGDFGAASGASRFDAVLLDIDHTPEALLSDRSRAFYEEESMRRFSQILRPGGVFALWSDDPPAEAFTARLRAAFGEARAEPVVIERPLAGTPITQTVYLAWTAAPSKPRGRT